MKKSGQTAYPDISDILQRKAEGRKESAARSFSETIAMLEAMRERLAPINRNRETSRASRKPAGSQK
jgi:hypothetical protein